MWDHFVFRFVYHFPLPQHVLSLLSLTSHRSRSLWLFDVKIQFIMHALQHFFMPEFLDWCRGFENTVCIVMVWKDRTYVFICFWGTLLWYWAFHAIVIVMVLCILHCMYKVWSMGTEVYRLYCLSKWRNFILPDFKARPC